MDKVFIKSLEVETIIGIWESEKKTKQKIILDIEISTDAKAASLKDTIDATINYQDVAERIIDFTSNSSFQLVETLAEAICKIILDEFLSKWVKVTVTKIKVVKDVSFVGVTIERKKEEYNT
tara:strand:- start:13121 stop:13486 length:366 start_codon:yes stop_codon:yes gene_type:complete